MPATAQGEQEFARVCLITRFAQLFPIEQHGCIGSDNKIVSSVGERKHHQSFVRRRPLRQSFDRAMIVFLGRILIGWGNSHFKGDIEQRDNLPATGEAEASNNGSFFDITLYTPGPQRIRYEPSGETYRAVVLIVDDKLHAYGREY